MYSSLFQKGILLILFYRSFISSKLVLQQGLENPKIGKATSYKADEDYNCYEEDCSAIHKVPLQDLRTMKNKPDLKAFGFTYVRERHVQITEPWWQFSNTQKKALTEDSVKLVVELTGAKFAISYGGQYRDSKTRGIYELNSNIHSDLSPEGTGYMISAIQEMFLDSEFPEEQEFGGHLAGGSYDVVFYNVWRPLERVEDNPLGFCKWDSVKSSDRVTSKIRPDSASNALQVWNYEAHQEWYYLSRQEPHEVYVFTQHDDRVGDGQDISVPHASFWFKNEEQTHPTRKSFECRIIALFPKK